MLIINYTFTFDHSGLKFHLMIVHGGTDSRHASCNISHYRCFLHVWQLFSLSIVSAILVIMCFPTSPTLQWQFLWLVCNSFANSFQLSILSITLCSRHISSKFSKSPLLIISAIYEFWLSVWWYVPYFLANSSFIPFIFLLYLLIIDARFSHYIVHCSRIIEF